MIVRSPYPDVEIPEGPLTPFVLRHAERLANKPALIDGATGRSLTYGELAAHVKQAARGLAAHGLRKGDVCVICAPSSLEYVVAFHAIASLGGIVSPINPADTPEELVNHVHNVEARYLIAGPALMDWASDAVRRSRIQELFVFGERPGATSFASLLRSHGSLPRQTIDPREDVVVLLRSSGTTGLPKNVMLTQFNLVAFVSQLIAAGEDAEGDILPGHLPFFHLFGVGITMAMGLAVGATSVLMDRFGWEPFLRMLQDYRVTRAYLVPPLVVKLAKEPVVDDYDLSHLATIVCGAAPLGQDIARTCARRLDCRVKQLYGMTETGVTHLAPDDVDPGKVGAVGLCTPNTECKVVAVSTGREIDPGEQGELWVRTPVMMKGYLNRPDATAETIDAAGWLRTGDIGYVDDDGYFTIVDPLKEMIKYKGHQVAPAELEAILLSHPAVADAAVIPSPDEDAGEVPKAFIVLKAEATPEELMAFVATKSGSHNKVRRIEFVDQIPKSASGKILRRVLVERERAALLISA